MVSIRKRRHLGIQERYRILNQVSRLNGRHHANEPKVVVMESSYQRGNIDSLDNGIERKVVLEAQPGPSLIMGGSSSKDMNNRSQGCSLKSRKSSRRKQSENQDACMLRGVYYKNMKWQAAIKVDKKQIHLGTVASMEEAAHLYDRAAYLCGRVPNFELSDEEKQELQGLQWEEFLLRTKEAIANKKKRKRVETCIRRRRTTASVEDGEIDASSFYQPESFLQTESFDEAASFHQQQAASFHQAPSFHSAASFRLPASLQEASFAANSPFS